jgi:hypothetical protein
LRGSHSEPMLTFLKVAIPSLIRPPLAHGEKKTRSPKRAIRKWRLGYAEYE